MEQEAESTFWVDHVLTEQSSDLQEWFTLDMSLPPNHFAPAAEVESGTPREGKGSQLLSWHGIPPHSPYTFT